MEEGDVLNGGPEKVRSYSPEPVVKGSPDLLKMLKAAESRRAPQETEMSEREEQVTEALKTDMVSEDAVECCESTGIINLLSVCSYSYANTALHCTLWFKAHKPNVSFNVWPTSILTALPLHCTKYSYMALAVPLNLTCLVVLETWRVWNGNFSCLTRSSHISQSCDGTRAMGFECKETE